MSKQYWQGKGAGKKIAIRFTKPLLGDVTGNETAFTVKGMVRNPLKYGPLTEKTFAVESVERYPLEQYWQDEFSGELDGLEAGEYGLRLEAAPFLDDFSDPLESQNIWTIGKHGGSGTQAYADGESVLTPEQNKINSVSARANGDFTSVKVRVKLSPDAQNHARCYFDITLGSGGIVDFDDGLAAKWWHTVLASGYIMTLQTENNTTGITLSRRDGAGTQKTELGRVRSPTNWTTQYHDYEIQIHDTGVKFLVDDSAIGSYSDTTYKTGDILLAQGEHSNGAGAIARIDSVTAEPGGHIPTASRTLSLDASTLPPAPRFRCETSTPDDTDITIEYACTAGDEPDSEGWAEIADGDLLTITGTTLWLRYTLTTDDPAVTPTLLSAWLEEPTAPPGTILLTMAPDSRFNDVEGDITVSYEQATGTLTGNRPVEDFEESFTPTDLEPTPIDRHDITAGIEVAVDLIKVDYRYFKDDSADHIITAGITVEVDLIPVSEIPP